MRYTILLAAFMFTTVTFAHETTHQEKKMMYDSIAYQYEQGSISLESAQKLWRTYINCCREDKSKA